MKRLIKKGFGVLAAAVIGLYSACGSNNDNPWKGHGGAGEPCYPNNTCNAGLVCVDDVCESDAGLDADLDAGISDAGDASADVKVFDGSLDGDVDSSATDGSVVDGDIDSAVDSAVCTPLSINNVYPAQNTQVETRDHYLSVGVNYVVDGNCATDVSLSIIDDNATTDATEDDLLLYEGSIDITSTNLETILSTTSGFNGDQITAGDHIVLFRFDVDGQTTDATTTYEHVPTIAIKDGWRYVNLMHVATAGIDIEFNVLNFTPGPWTNVTYSVTSDPPDYWPNRELPRIRGPPMQPIGEIEADSNYPPLGTITLFVTAHDNITNLEDTRDFVFEVEPYQLRFFFTYSDSSQCWGLIMTDMTNYVMNGIAGFPQIQPPYNASHCGSYYPNSAELNTVESRLQQVQDLFPEEWDVLYHIENNVMPCLETMDVTPVADFEVRVCNQ